MYRHVLLIRLELSFSESLKSWIKLFSLSIILQYGKLPLTKVDPCKYGIYISKQWWCCCTGKGSFQVCSENSIPFDLLMIMSLMYRCYVCFGVYYYIISASCVISFKCICYGTYVCSIIVYSALNQTSLHLTRVVIDCAPCCLPVRLLLGSVPSLPTLRYWLLAEMMIWQESGMFQHFHFSGVFLYIVRV